MKNLLIAPLACLALLAVCDHTEPLSAGSSPAQASVAPIAETHKISAAEAQKMISESKDYVLLDVRTEKEYRHKRIDGAYLIPDNELKDRAATELPDKDKVILLYCRSGRRSAKAAKTLARMGYTNVYDFGGIINWPFATVSD